MKHRELFNRFLEQYRDDAKGWHWIREYPLPKIELDPEITHNNSNLNNIIAYRIDALGCKRKSYFIIEIKRTLYFDVLAQLLIYRNVLSIEKDVSQEDIFLGVVYENDEPFIRNLLESYGIKLFKIK